MSFNFGTTAVATPAASPGFSFGGTSAPATGATSTGGGFSFGGGTPTATPAPSASGGFSFGGSTATPAAAPAASGGFSFGATSAAPASTGFGFGGASTTTAAAAPASSGNFSFAGSSTAAAAPASTGFSFGGASTAAPAATASSGGFSFGAAAPVASTGTSLFGGAATATSATPSLFGGSATTTGSSLFGAKPAGSLFGGATTPATTTTSFGGFGGGFGAPQQQPQAAPAQPSIKLETTFDALPADVKKNMTEFHKFLKDEDQSDAFLKSVSARKLDALKSNLDQLEQDVLVRRNLQDRQATAVHHVRKDVKHLINQVDTATLNLRSMSGESTSQRFYGIMRRVEMPSPYYWELLDNFEARMEQLKAQIENVETEFQPLYEKQRRGAGGFDAASLSGVDPALLQQILLSQNSALIQVAAHVAEVHEKTEEMRQAFIRKMKEDLLKHGDKNLTGFKNPFDKKKKNTASRESDIDNIRFKTSVTPTIVATQQPQAPAAAPATGFGGFGTTTTEGTWFGTTPTGATSLSGSGSAPTISTGGFGTTSATPAATSSSGGFNFGSTTTASTTAPKQVSFSLGGGSTTPTVSTGASPSGFGFGAPSTPTPSATSAAAPGGFGAVGSSFLPASTPAFGAGDKRTAGTAGSKSGGLRSRQKKR